MIPQIFYNIENIKEDEQRWQYLSVQLKSYYDLLNRGLGFTDNFNSRTISATFAAINTNTSFEHGLGFTPTGYIPIGYTAAMSLYDGSTAWNKTNIVLKSDAVGVARILVF